MMRMLKDVGKLPVEKESKIDNFVKSVLGYDCRNVA